MRTSYPAAVPILLQTIAMLSFQAGAALAKGLFPLVGAAGTTALRLSLAALMLSVLWRPWRMRFTLREGRVILVYGIAMGCMNLLFYSSLERIPLGIAVALEFTGPLAVAMAASRKPVDFFWILLTAAALLALLPLRTSVGPQALAPSGILMALGAGACWALYILAGRRAGASHGGQTTAIGVLIATCIILPVGLAQNGLQLFAPALLPTALGMAVLSSALPYSLEMYAMPRIPTLTFGVMMSGDPALAALAGWVFLAERLTWVQWLAVIGIVVASAGSAATSRASAKEAMIS